MTQREILPYVALFCLAGAILLPALGKARYMSTYAVAQSIAEKTYGDKKEPLTEAEKTEWYKEMGFKDNERPSPIQLEGKLEAFIKSHPKN